MSDRDYCKLYVKSDRSFEGLKSTVSAALEAPVEGRTVEGHSMSVDCFANKAHGDGDGFLYWPYYLEIEIYDGSDELEFVKEIQNLIDALKGEAIQIVASCDFEDELMA